MCQSVSMDALARFSYTGGVTGSNTCWQNMYNN